MSIPEQFAGRGDSFVLQVRGDSMIDAASFRRFIVVQRQTQCEHGEIVVAGDQRYEATVKRYFRKGRIVLKPENSQLEPWG